MAIDTGNEVTRGGSGNALGAIDLSPKTADSAVTDRLFVREGFQWVDNDAYLFDIDSTLVQAKGGVHFDAFASSVLDVLGHALSFDGVPIHGSTDTGILRDAFRQAAIAEDIWLPRLEEILERMRDTVFARREFMNVLVLPGVIATLAYLQARGKALGVATGNLEQIGWLKLERAGLRDWFSFGGFSDRYAVRAKMIADAVTRARQVAGERASVCVVGDTPSDIAAAKANGLPTIAVATGIYGFDELLEHGPEVCTSTLETLLHRTVDRTGIQSALPKR